MQKDFSTRKCRYIERDFESLPMFCTYSISRHLEENEAQDLLRCLVLNNGLMKFLDSSRHVLYTMQ